MGVRSDRHELPRPRGSGCGWIGAADYGHCLVVEGDQRRRPMAYPSRQKKGNSRGGSDCPGLRPALLGRLHLGPGPLRPDETPMASCSRRRGLSVYADLARSDHWLGCQIFVDAPDRNSPGLSAAQAGQCHNRGIGIMAVARIAISGEQILDDCRSGLEILASNRRGKLVAGQLSSTPGTPNPVIYTRKDRDQPITKKRIKPRSETRVRIFSHNCFTLEQCALSGDNRTSLDYSKEKNYG